MSKKIAFIVLILFCLSACSQGQEEISAPDVVITEPPATDTSAPTDVPPTDTPEPTVPPTEEPTSTPRPTFSPETITLSAGDPIQIAYLLWDQNPIGLDEVRAIEIAIADFGAEIQGHPIELTGLNSECNEFAGQQGAQILMQNKSILGVIGTTCTLPALKAAPIISENNRVLISPSTTGPDLTAPDVHSQGFARTVPSDLTQIIATSKFAFDSLGVRKMAIVRGETYRYQRLIINALCEQFSELGGECIMEIPKYDGSTYVTPIINSLADAGADAVYFLAWNFEEIGAFITAFMSSNELNDVPLFIFGQPGNKPILEEAGEDAIGVYISETSFEIDYDSDHYQEFLSTYQKDYGEEPIGNYHPYAYDATILLLKAIDQVAVPGDDGSLMVDPLAVRDAMYNKVEFQGLSGYISCSPLGDCLSTASGKVYEFISGDPSTFNPGPADSLSSNPVQVWP